jgi:hypothetical protein
MIKEVPRSEVWTRQPDAATGSPKPKAASLKLFVARGNRIMELR